MTHSAPGNILLEQAVARSTEIFNQLVDLPQVAANPDLEILGLDELGLHLIALPLLRLFDRLGVQLFILFADFGEDRSRPLLFGIVGIVLVVGVFTGTVLWVERGRAVLFGIGRRHSFERVSEDVAVVEEPAKRQLLFERRLYSCYSGKVEEDAFLSVSVPRLWFFLLFCLRLLRVAFIILSFLTLLGEILGIVLILRNGLFVVSYFQLIGIVKHLDEPVKILLLMQIQNDIVTLLLLSRHHC